MPRKGLRNDAKMRAIWHKNLQEKPLGGISSSSEEHADQKLIEAALREKKVEVKICPTRKRKIRVGRKVHL